MPKAILVVGYTTYTFDLRRGGEAETLGSGGDSVICIASSERDGSKEKSKQDLFEVERN